MLYNYTAKLTCSLTYDAIIQKVAMEQVCGNICKLAANIFPALRLYKQSLDHHLLLQNLQLHEHTCR